MPAGRHDQMVVHCDPQRLARAGDASGEVHVGAAWRGVAAGVVVDQQDRGCVKLDRAADHLAHMDRRFVDRPARDHFVADQPAPAVEMQHPGDFDRAEGVSEAQIIEQGRPVIEHRSARETQGRDMRQRRVEPPDQSIEVMPVPQHPQPRLPACRQHAGQRAEFLDQSRRQDGGARARYGLKESLQDLSAP